MIKPLISLSAPTLTAVYFLYWVGAELVRSGHPWLAGCWAVLAAPSTFIILLLVLYAVKDTARRVSVGEKMREPQLEPPPST